MICLKNNVDKMKKTTILEMNRLTVEEFHEAEKMPLIVVLDDVRSLYNVGSVFRTADAFRVEKLYLCGLTGVPTAENVVQAIHKTALGAEESVAWTYFSSAMEAVESLKEDGYTVLAVEQAHGSTMLQDWKADSPPTPPCEGGESFRYAVVLGNEVKGVHQEVIDICDGCLEVPQFGTKHSMNVSVTAGIIIWHFAQQLILKDKQ